MILLFMIAHQQLIKMIVGSEFISLVKGYMYLNKDVYLFIFLLFKKLEWSIH